jgi:hypothetical protein
LKTRLSRRGAGREVEKTVHRGGAEDAEKRRRRKNEDGQSELSKALKAFAGRVWEQVK